MKKDFDDGENVTEVFCVAIKYPSGDCQGLV